MCRGVLRLRVVDVRAVHQHEDHPHHDEKEPIVGN
jgi:hypothetical protein